MKRGLHLIFIMFVILIIGSVVSAGFSDWVKKITGEATDAAVDMNISVGSGSGPTIVHIYNPSTSQINNLGPSNTNLTFNFSVSDADGYANLNDASIKFNLSNSGVGRQNITACAQYQTNGNFANYSCNTTMWWFDASGAWTVNISISDNNGNNVTNDSSTFTVGVLTGFVSGPGNISWSTIQPNSYNNTPDNWIVLNNTGNSNVDSGNVEINATDLKGEITATQALWATNFSIGTTTSAINPECDLGGDTATNMTNGTSGATFVSIANSVINAGNYTVNNNVTGQETLYMCLQYAGLELSEQRYSTVTEGTWSIKIV